MYVKIKYTSGFQIVRFFFIYLFASKIPTTWNAHLDKIIEKATLFYGHAEACIAYGPIR